MKEKRSGGGRRGIFVARDKAVGSLCELMEWEPVVVGFTRITDMT